MTRPRDWADTWLAPALVVLVVAVVFARCVAGEFVADDHLAIAGNPGVTSPGSWWAFFADPAAVDPYRYVRPLRHVEFAVDWALFGGRPAGFHVHSIAWHAVGAVFLLLVLRRVVGDARAALAGALLWAVHPVAVEPVAWIAARSDVAAAACSFAAVHFALRTRGADRDLAAALVATALALLYKETALALPLVVAALRWTRFSVARVWPFVAVVAAYLVYRTLARHGVVDQRDFLPTGVGVDGVLATSVRAAGFFLAETLLPTQAFDWHIDPSRSFADGAVVLWLVVHAALVASAVAARRRAPVWTLAVAWFYVFLLPVANWPVHLGTFTAERYLYAPLAGAAIAFAWALSIAPRAARPAAAVIVVALAAGSVARCGIFRDEDALYDAALASHESPLALEHVGGVARDRAVARIAADHAVDDESRRDLERALDAFHRLLRAVCASTPSERPVGVMAARAEVNASSACWFLGRDDEALFHAQEALRIDPTLPQAEVDRALPLLRMGFAPQAIAAMRRARTLGFFDADEGVGAILLDAADRCRGDGLLGAAQDGYETATWALPDGPRRRAAAEALAALRAAPRSIAAASAERARIDELDAALARRPRGCPFDP